MKADKSTCIHKLFEDNMNPNELVRAQDPQTIRLHVSAETNNLEFYGSDPLGIFPVDFPGNFDDKIAVGRTLFDLARARSLFVLAEHIALSEKQLIKIFQQFNRPF